MDSLNFGKLKDIYEDAATTYSPELKKNQSKSWFETHPLLINLLIILLIAIITLRGVVITNRNNRTINKENLEASQIEVDRKLTLSLNEKWIENFREVVSVYLSMASIIFSDSLTYLREKKDNTDARQAKTLTKINNNTITLNNHLTKLSLVLNFYEKEENDLYKLILSYNSWLSKLYDLDNFDAKILAKEFLEQELKITEASQRIITGAISGIFNPR